MLQDQQFEGEKLWNRGYPKSQTHSVSPIQQEYFDQLSDSADIDHVPNILVTLALDATKRRSENPMGFRDFKFTIIDNKTYIREKYRNGSMAKYLME